MSSDHRKYGWYRRRHRVDFQVFVMTAVIVILSCGLTFFLSFNFTYTGMIGGLENRANSIHDYTEEILDVRMFEELEGQEDEESPIYIQNKDLMERVRRASGIRYLYTARKTEDGRFVYLVDALHSENSDFRHLGDVVEPERVPDMQKALDG